MKEHFLFEDYRKCSENASFLVDLKVFVNFQLLKFFKKLISTWNNLGNLMKIKIIKSFSLLIFFEKSTFQ